MSKWVSSWRYVPIDYNQTVGTFENITQRSVFRNNLDGEKARLTFNNLYNDVPMHIRHVELAARDRVTGQTRKAVVTLNGSENIVLPPNTTPVSDEVSLHITCDDDFIVSMYFEEKTELRSVCTANTGYSWFSVHQTGNFAQTDALGFTVRAQLVPVLANDPYPCQFAAGLCDISVLTGDDVKLVAMFGDSITHMSYFSDSLLMRLYERYPGQCAVINGGISGNRLQKTYPPLDAMPGQGHQFGIAGADRFLRDLYTGPHPDIVFVLEGVNDCSHSIIFGEDVPTPEDILDALQKVIQEAHGNDSKVYVSTIPPFGAFDAPWRDQADGIRCAYNDLIRTRQPGDGWIDLDAALRDPDDPHRMQMGMHLGDGVHPSWMGGARMAKAVFEKWFEDGVR